MVSWLAEIILPESVRATSTEANGVGWSCTYDCLMLDNTSLSYRSIIPAADLNLNNGTGTGTGTGFFILVQTLHFLNPIYLPQYGSFSLDSHLDDTGLHFHPTALFSVSDVHSFVITILQECGVPATDPDPLVRLILSFALHHRMASTTEVVPLQIGFTITTVLRNHDEAIDWLHGGTAYSQITHTLRSTCASVLRLKKDSFHGSSLNSDNSCCMVCLEGFEDDLRRKVSRLPCKHEFHFRCIREWLQFNHRCPICRSPMPWVHAILPTVPLISRSSH